MNKTIGIFGDSWSCGVWDTINNEYRVSHLGINHYLYTDNFHSTNFSSPGSCNNENLNNLKRYHHDFDIKLFVITEPFRDFYYNPKLYDSNKTFEQNCKTLVDSQLKEIETLCGESCIVVGGLHKINTDNKFMYSANWCELIDSKADWPVYYADPGQLGQKLKNNEIVVKDLLDTRNDEEYCEKYFKTMADLPKYFWPDGRHPNILGHKILYKEIKTILNDISREGTTAI